MLQLFVGNFESCESWKTWIWKTGWTFNEFSVFHYLVGNHQPHLKNGFSTRDARKFQVSGWRWKNKTRMINQTPGKVKPERRLRWVDFSNRFQWSNQTTNNNQLLRQLFEIHALKLTAQPVDIGHPKEKFIFQPFMFRVQTAVFREGNLVKISQNNPSSEILRCPRHGEGRQGRHRHDWWRWPWEAPVFPKISPDWLATKGKKSKKTSWSSWQFWVRKFWHISFLYLKQWEMDGGVQWLLVDF